MADTAPWRYGGEKFFPCRWAVAVSMLVGLAMFSGCADGPTTRPTSWTDPTKADPWNYDPKVDKPDISGGGIGNFDKGAFKRDLDHVLSP